MSNLTGLNNLTEMTVSTNEISEIVLKPLSELYPAHLKNKIFVAHIFLMIVSVFTNLSVITGFLKYWDVLISKPRLKTNAFILNLAVFDLLVSAIVWPLSVIYKLGNHRWVFGQFLCHVWLDSDYVLTCGSVFNVAMLSLDRYLGMKMTAQYTVPQRTRNHVIFLMILATWLVPLLAFVSLNEIWALYGGSSMFTGADGRCLEPWQGHEKVVWAINVAISVPTLLCLIVPYTLLVAEVLKIRKATRIGNFNQAAPSFGMERKSFHLDLRLKETSNFSSGDSSDSCGDIDDDMRYSESSFGVLSRTKKLKQPSREDWTKLLNESKYKLVQQSFDLSRGRYQVEFEPQSKKQLEANTFRSLNIWTTNQQSKSRSVQDVSCGRNPARKSSTSSISFPDSLTRSNSVILSQSEFVEKDICLKLDGFSENGVGSEQELRTVFPHLHSRMNETPYILELNQKLSALERLAAKTASGIKQLDFLISSHPKIARTNSQNSSNLNDSMDLDTDSKQDEEAMSEQVPCLDEAFLKGRLKTQISLCTVPENRVPNEMQTSVDRKSSEFNRLTAIAKFAEKQRGSRVRRYTLPDMLPISEFTNSSSSSSSLTQGKRFLFPSNVSLSEMRQFCKRSMVGRRTRNAVSEGEREKHFLKTKIMSKIKRRRNSLSSFKTSLKRRASTISQMKVRIWVTTPENAKFVGHVIVLVATCLICWIPYCIISTADWSRLVIFHPITFDFAVWLVYLNSLLNPFLYLSQNKTVRKAVKKTVASLIPKFLRRRPDCLSMYIWYVLGCRKTSENFSRSDSRLPHCSC